VSPSEGVLCRALIDADGTNVLVLDGFTSPSGLLYLVAERLNRAKQRAPNPAVGKAPHTGSLLGVNPNAKAELA
jgi:hypothetical protein